MEKVQDKISEEEDDKWDEEEVEVHTARSDYKPSTSTGTLSYVKEGVDAFKFPNDDLYVGAYRATFERDICRQGKGVYYTADNQSYNGIWEKDDLVDEARIVFPDGSRYTGQLSNFTYTGQGQYEFPDGSTMECAFVNNWPVDRIMMRDPTGHLWYGMAEEGGVTLKPLNHFLADVKKRVYEDEQAKSVLLHEDSLEIPSGSLKSKSLLSSKSSVRSRSSSRSSFSKIKNSKPSLTKKSSPINRSDSTKLSKEGPVLGRSN